MAAAVVVVGGGVIGLSCAVALAWRDALVTLVAADGAQGCGPSGTPTGILMPTDGRPPETLVQHERLDAYATLPAWIDRLERETGQSVDYTESGVIRLAAEPVVTLRGPEPWLTGVALQQRLGIMPPAHMPWGLPLPGAHLAAHRLLAALRTALAIHGGRLVPQTVTQFTTVGHRVTGVQLADGHVLAADHMVLAAGLHAQPLLDQCALPIHLEGDSGQVLQVTAAHYPKTIVHLDDVTFVPKADQTLWATGIRRRGDTTIRRDPADADRLRGVAQQICGDSVQDAGDWAQVRPRIAGSSGPVVAAAPPWSHFTVALGHGGNGLLLSAWTAARVTDLVVSSSAQG